MKDLEKVEDIYKKYFSEPVQYSESWKYPMLENLENKKQYFYNPYLKFASVLVAIMIIFVVGLKISQIYSIKQEKQHIKGFLLSESAFDFVMYRNYGTIIYDYYIKSSYEEQDLSEILYNTEEMLSLYWFIYNKDFANGGKIELVNEAIEEAALSYIEYYTNNFQNGLI